MQLPVILALPASNAQTQQLRHLQFAMTATMQKQELATVQFVLKVTLVLTERLQQLVLQATTVFQVQAVALFALLVINVPFPLLREH